MSKTVSKVLKENWENLLCVVIAIPILVVDFIGIDFFPENIVGSMTLAMLIVIAISQIKNNVGGRIIKKVDNSILKIDDLTSISRGKLSIVKPKEEPSIWKNFKGRFYCLNAPWALEDNSDTSWDDMIESYKETYGEEDFVSATYIFYKHGPVGHYYPKAIGRFADFCEAARKKSPAVFKKLNVIIVDDAPAPPLTAFIGKKGRGDAGDSASGSDRMLSYAIVYLGEAPFTNNNGVPNLAIVSVNDSFNEKIEYMIDQTLSKYDLQSAEQFLGSYSKKDYAIAQ